MAKNEGQIFMLKRDESPELVESMIDSFNKKAKKRGYKEE